MLRRFIIYLIFIIFITPLSFAQREIAITIDDLPFVGESKNFHLEMIINSIKNNEVPATGFVIAREVRPKNWPVLHKFKEAGLELGNHTLTHLNLNKVSSDTYIQEIEEADRILKPILTEPKYFRYPYLAMSEGKKKSKVIHFLEEKNYQIAPITIDSRDFTFNQLLLAVPQNERRKFLTVLKSCYLNFIWQQTLKAEENNHSAHKDERAQILLIHSNLLNAYVLTDIINLYKEKGYQFVSLGKALKTFKEKPKRRAKKEKKKTNPINNFFAWD